MQKQRKQHSVRQKLFVGAIAMSLTVVPMQQTTEAFGAWDAANALLGSAQVYNTYRTTLLELNDNPKKQDKDFKEAVAANEASTDAADLEIVDEVMKNLTSSDNFAMDEQSLPFRWHVSTSKDFNASCNGTNNVVVNHGLLSGLNYNKDEVAAVLGHELIHGLNHHSANHVAQIVATTYGMNLLSSGESQINVSLMQCFEKYVRAKNIILPDEYEADEGGFYLAAGAGFNPGGCAAAMAKMKSFTESASGLSDFFNPNDHPDTNRRVEKGAALMSTYGYNHVTVKGGDSVYIDGAFFVKAQADGNTTAEEVAYLIAGGIAKGFHDQRFATMWDFNATGAGMEFLDDNPVYVPLKAAVARENLGATLEKLVTAAYAADSASGNRMNILADEMKKQEAIKEIRVKSQAYDKGLADKHSKIAAAYGGMNLHELAIVEYNRSLKHDANDAFTYGNRANSYISTGEYESAVADCSKAISINPKLAYLYGNRATAYSKLGNNEAALADCDTALKYDSTYYRAEHLVANIYNDKNDFDNALKHYRKYKILNPKANDIPEAYLSSLN